MERTRARNRPTHRPHRKHGEPPNSHMELGRYGGALAASARKVVCSVKPVYYYTADFGKVLGRSRVALTERDSWTKWPLLWTLKAVALRFGWKLTSQSVKES